MHFKLKDVSTNNMKKLLENLRSLELELSFDVEEEDIQDFEELISDLIKDKNFELDSIKAFDDETKRYILYSNGDVLAGLEDDLTDQSLSRSVKKELQREVSRRAELNDILEECINGK